VSKYTSKLWSPCTKCQAQYLGYWHPPHACRRTAIVGLVLYWKVKFSACRPRRRMSVKIYTVFPASKDTPYN
jgi:hypothetical protein